MSKSKNSTLGILFFLTTLSTLVTTLPANADMGDIARACREWRFGRSNGDFIGNMRLLSGGRISGYTHPNEDSWGVENGDLVFYGDDGSIKTTFNSAYFSRSGKLTLSGPLKGSNIVHTLKCNN